MLRASFRAALLDETGKPTRNGGSILAHLRMFCNADVSTASFKKDGSMDALDTARREGRREVWLQFALYLNMDEGDLIEWDRHFQEQMRNEMARAREPYKELDA